MMGLLDSRIEHGRRSGFVLVSVLWILAILTVVALGFARRASLERRVAWYALDREQAQQMARGAAERALFELANKHALDEYNNQGGYTGADQRWARPVDLYAESVYFVTGAGSDRESYAEDVCMYRIEDCERRISLNHAQRAWFEELDAFDFRTLEAIFDRRKPRAHGFQRDRFASVDGVLALEDFDRAVWYGNGEVDGLRDLLTVWGDGGGRVNVNTASASVLSVVPDIERDVVERVIEYRSGADGVLYTADDRSFTSTRMIASRLKISAEKVQPLIRHCKTDSRFFTITAQATRRRGKIRAFCQVTVELQGNDPVILEWKEDTVGS